MEEMEEKQGTTGSRKKKKIRRRTKLPFSERKASGVDRLSWPLLALNLRGLPDLVTVSVDSQWLQVDFRWKASQGGKNKTRGRGNQRLQIGNPPARSTEMERAILLAAYTESLLRQARVPHRVPVRDQPWPCSQATLWWVLCGEKTSDYLPAPKTSQKSPPGSRKRRQPECTHCDPPPAPGHKRCAAHLLAYNARLSALRVKRKAMGLCIQCGQHAVPGRTRCRLHAIQMGITLKALRQPRKAQGLCIDCTEPAVPNRARCERHMAESRADGLRRNRKKRAQKLDG